MAENMSSVWLSSMKRLNTPSTATTTMNAGANRHARENHCRPRSRFSLIRAISRVSKNSSAAEVSGLTALAAENKLSSLLSASSFIFFLQNRFQGLPCPECPFHTYPDGNPGIVK
jgi:hypothetical protein